MYLEAAILTAMADCQVGDPDPERHQKIHLGPSLFFFVPLSSHSSLPPSPKVCSIRLWHFTIVYTFTVPKRTPIREARIVATMDQVVPLLAQPLMFFTRYPTFISALGQTASLMETVALGISFPRPVLPVTAMRRRTRFCLRGAMTFMTCPPRNDTQAWVLSLLDFVAEKARQSISQKETGEFGLDGWLDAFSNVFASLSQTQCYRSLQKS